MAAHEHVGDQFRQVVLPGLGGMHQHPDRRKTYFGEVPEQPEGHTRLWRSSVGTTKGWWADRPMTGFGDQMHYMDVPHESLSEHQVSKGVYNFGAHHDRTTSLPGKPQRVKITGSKPYEISDKVVT